MPTDYYLCILLFPVLGQCVQRGCATVLERGGQRTIADTCIFREIKAAECNIDRLPSAASANPETESGLRSEAA